MLKVGRAVHSLKNADDEDKRRWAKNYLIEVLGQSRGLPAKAGSPDADETEPAADKAEVVEPA